jgi:hypothetical protein
MADNQGIQKAGDVIIEQLKLISSTNVVYDLADFLIELNLYEDIFSNYLTGSIVLSDSRNLFDMVPILGEEYLVLKFVTPSFPASVQKTFRIYKATDRQIVRDKNTQTYALHFASIELFYDVLLPLYTPFEGNITDVVGGIFNSYIAENRNFQISEASDEIKEIEGVTPLYIKTDAANSVKFISPGWTPFKCINWLASKAIPMSGVAKNFLFFESNKGFYFTSVETLFREASEGNTSIGKYSISAAGIRQSANQPDLDREYFLAKDVEMVATTDHIKNYTNGYLANRLITLDLYNKEYAVTNYDYVNSYGNQYHSSGSGAASTPIFTNGSLRNPATSISFYPINPRLFQTSLEEYFKDNVSEKMKDIYGNRKSSLLDLTNLRMNISVPGRTDVEVGRTLYFSYPAINPKSSSDANETQEDSNYSGYYLITAIRHKVSKLNHTMVMEIVKDSLTTEKTVK